MTAALATAIQTYQQRCNQHLELLLGQIDPISPELLSAMKYSLLGGGKRIRPVLVYAAATAVGEVSPTVDAVAAALECVHAYSLIHDDLPAMDDDDLRRGRPTCHIAFDEATAILAGDALLTLAFEHLASHTPSSSELGIQLLAHLAKASGSTGMVAGQALDLAAVDQVLSVDELEAIHRAKTGALIKASVVMGAMATNVANKDQLVALEAYADAIGLAFQVQDDVLDVTGDTDTIGKNQGSDARLHKPTYVSLLGLDGARHRAQALHNQAFEALTEFDHRADLLRDMSAYIVDRDR